MPRFAAALLITVVLLGLPAPVRCQTAPPATFDVAFVADGAGNYQVASKQLRAVVAQTGVPLNVETFVWSHGYKKILQDETDLPHSRQQGRCLAETVIRYRQQHPDAKIHLIGHSAGSMVVLSATEFLPPQTIDRIVLLLPSVSTGYDIRPALRSVKGSMEVHFSSQDWFYLGLCTRVVGLADRGHGDAGGRVGFQLRIETPDDAALLPRLVQYPWHASYRELGNDGGHYGAYQPEYLKARILPVLLGSN